MAFFTTQHSQAAHYNDRDKNTALTAALDYNSADASYIEARLYSSFSKTLNIKQCGQIARRAARMNK